MTNTASTNAKHQASPPVRTHKDWTKPVLDILELESAEHGFSHVNDNLTSHRSG
jgi:hypothetical protein